VPHIDINNNNRPLKTKKQNRGAAFLLFAPLATMAAISSNGLQPCQCRMPDARCQRHAPPATRQEVHQAPTSASAGARRQRQAPIAHDGVCDGRWAAAEARNGPEAEARGPKRRLPPPPAPPKPGAPRAPKQAPGPAGLERYTANDQGTKWALVPVSPRA
jgi:hypothetical protein